MKTTALYVRVSTDRRTQARTIERQLERLKAHLESQGETLCAENILRDDGYSGASLNRPGLDQLRDWVRRSVLNRVMITSPDRLARNYVHQMDLIEELEPYPDCISGRGASLCCAALEPALAAISAWCACTRPRLPRGGKGDRP